MCFFVGMLPNSNPHAWGRKSYTLSTSKCANAKSLYPKSIAGRCEKRLSFRLRKLKRDNLALWIDGA